MDKESKRKKRQWQFAEKEKTRDTFPLPDSQLENLFESVHEQLLSAPCDHTLRWTLLWTTDNKKEEEPLLAWLRENGGYCDCEVVANAGGFFDENRITP